MASDLSLPLIQRCFFFVVSCFFLLLVFVFFGGGGGGGGGRGGGGGGEGGGGGAYQQVIKWNCSYCKKILQEVMVSQYLNSQNSIFFSFFSFCCTKLEPDS